MCNVETYMLGIRDSQSVNIYSLQHGNFLELMITNGAAGAVLEGLVVAQPRLPYSTLIGILNPQSMLTSCSYHWPSGALSFHALDSHVVLFTRYARHAKIKPNSMQSQPGISITNVVYK